MLLPLALRCCVSLIYNSISLDALSLRIGAELSTILSLSRPSCDNLATDQPTNISNSSQAGLQVLRHSSIADPISGDSRPTHRPTGSPHAHHSSHTQRQEPQLHPNHIHKTTQPYPRINNPRSIPKQAYSPRVWTSPTPLRVKRNAYVLYPA